MITCELCGTVNSDEAVYCQTCGERIQDNSQADIQEHLKQALDLLEAEKHKEAIIEFEKAAILGWKGEYCIVAEAYASELFAAEKDSIKKAFKWFERFYSDFRAGKIEYKSLFSIIDGLDSGIDIRIRYAEEVLSFTDNQRDEIISKLTEIFESILTLISQNNCNEKLNDDSKRKTADILLSIGVSYYYGLILHGRLGEFEIPVNVKKAFQAFQLSKELGNKKAKLFIDEMSKERIVSFRRPLTKNVWFGESRDYCFLDVDADDGLIEKDEGYFRLISRMIQSEEYTLSAKLHTDIQLGYLKKGLDRLLSSLGEEEYDVLKYIYGLDYEEPLSYRATAVKLDIPYSKIIEIEEQSIKKLQACEQTKMLKELLLDDSITESSGVDYSEMFEDILNKEINEFLCNNDIVAEGYLSKAVIENYSSQIKKMNGDLKQVRGLNENMLKRVGINKLYELLILSDEQFTEIMEAQGHPVPRHVISRLRSLNRDLRPIAFGFAKGGGNQFNVKDMFDTSEETPITRMHLSYTTIEQLLRRGYLFLSDMTRDRDWSILDESKELIVHLCCGGDKMKRVYISSSLAYYMHIKGIDSLSGLKKKYEKMPWNLQRQTIELFHSHNGFNELSFEKPEEIGLQTDTIRGYNLYVKPIEEHKHMGVYSLWNKDLTECICAFDDYDDESIRYIAKKISAVDSNNRFIMSRKELDSMYEFNHEQEMLCAIHDYNCSNGITEYEVLQ